MPEPIKNPIGVVSNCFSYQLEHGISLHEILKRLMDEGFEAIELRQTCLGECESKDHLADVTAIGNLCAGTTCFTFDYAMSYPFLSADHDHDHDLHLNAGIDAAIACGGHMRLVDLSTTSEELEASLDDTATNLRELIGRVTDRGIRLSIEHSRQTWRQFWTVCERLKALGAESLYEFCFDPANFCMADMPETWREEFVSLRLDQISMIHLK